MGKKINAMALLKKVKQIHQNNLNEALGNINSNSHANKKKNRRKKKNRKNQFFSEPSKSKDNISNQTNFNFININNFNNNSNQISYNNYKNEKEIPLWMTNDLLNIRNTMERFNEELYQYVNYIIPKNLSLNKRENTIEIFKKIINENQPNWKVVLFGSFSQNTSTVFSDLDFEIHINKNCSRRDDIKLLLYIMKILKKNGFSENIMLIKAKVPILKATCNMTGIKVDISVNRDNGSRAAKEIRNILDKYKILKPSIIILKILLRNNYFNDGATGGMNSFLLFHLVYFFYIIYIKRKQNNILPNKNETKIYASMSEKVKNNFYINLSNKFICKEEKENKYHSNYKKRNNLNYRSKSILNSSSLNSNRLKSNGYSWNSFKFWNPSSYNSNKEKKENYFNENNYYKKEDCNKNKIFGRFSEKLEEKKNNNKNDINIGDFIFAFLKFYGKEFDYKNLGFSLYGNNFGITFFKSERNDMECGEYICVESIQESKVDIGKSCYHYPLIANLFKQSYSKIKFEMQKNTFSILKTLGFPTI